MLEPVREHFRKEQMANSTAVEANLLEVEATCMNLRDSLRDLAIAEAELDPDG